MFRHMLLLYWLLCVGTLAPARAQQIKDKADTEVSSLTNDIRLLRKEIRDIRKEFDSKLTNILNEKIADFIKVVQQQDMELVTLHDSVTQILQHLNTTMDNNYVNNTCIPVTNLTEIVTHMVKILTCNNSDCLEVDRVQPPITEISVTQQKCLNYTQRAVGLSCTKTPYMAALGFGEYRSETDWNAYAGVIISDRYILTSGFVTIRPNVTRVALGVEDIRYPQADWRVHEIIQNTVHPEYVYSEPHHNLALLKTDTPIQFSDRVQPACLPARGDLDAQPDILLNTFLKKSGLHGPVRTVTVQQYTDDQCSASYRAYNRTAQVCLGHRKDLQASCYSYSGDPAVMRSHDSACVSTVVGLLAYYAGCSYPDLYARLAAYVPWVESVVWPEATRVHN